MSYRIEGPAVINVSGGRTSGFMLHQILDAHHGKLPDDVIAVFCNTGREMPATLDFVLEMSVRWAVHIQWLEYRRDPVTGRASSEAVSHNSASRDGEPFEMAIEAHKWMLPTPKIRYCTEELKLKTVHRWVTRELGWGRYRRYIGLRHDELDRVQRIALRNAANKKVGHFASCPLAKARVSKSDVMTFWGGAEFDLGLAGDWEGNCDGCFLKRIAAIRRMTEEHPERMTWWQDKERRAVEYGYPNGRFRIDRDGYAEIAAATMLSPRLPGLVDEDVGGFDPFVDCEGGCGT